MAKIPEQLGTLTLVRQLGTGRHCQIWEAVDRTTGGRVAVKAVLPSMAADPVQRQLLAHELKVAKSLDHPTVIRIDRLCEERVPHLVMELFPHDDLKKQIAAGVTALVPKLQRLVTETALALDHVHSRGWVHRDFKPENVLAAGDGQVKLIDLAIAAKASGFLGKFLGAKNPPMGTPSYMSPEQIRGEALDARSDIYAFGCVLFELITGKPPYQAPNVNDLLNRHVSAPVPAVSVVNPNATTTVTDLLRKMLAKKPADRPASMRDVLKQLRTIRLLENATIS